MTTMTIERNGGIGLPRLGLVCALAACGMMCWGWLLADSTTADDSANAKSDAAAIDLPTIVLTGFEPFGPSRPANSSWEGIKNLDGRALGGYRLVCRRMPVVWGSPMKHLSALVKEHSPAAVFSFGQGAPGAFALETLASNERAPIPDNEGRTPPAPVIVQGGPQSYQASADCDRLVEPLVKKGHEVRISREAGRYLCEEALYTLEHLKARTKSPATMAFCHVPPLGEGVDAQFVERFVVDLLLAWQSQGGDAAATESPVRTKERAEVTALIKHYFSTWSRADIDAYGDCFLSEATIQFLDAGHRLHSYDKRNFLASQREIQSKNPATEVAESIDIRFEQKLVRAVVRWKLTNGQEKQGYDHFTLVKRGRDWRIVNLVFYETDD